MCVYICADTLSLRMIIQLVTMCKLSVLLMQTLLCNARWMIFMCPEALIKCAPKLAG